MATGRKHGMGAVVCPEPLAAAAAGKMLEQGGNAFDAIVAGAFAQGVVNPLMCGIGGTAAMLAHSLSESAPVFIRARSGAGEKARPDMYHGVEPSDLANRFRVAGYENYIGYKASVIPTLVRVLGETHRRFGQLPWKNLLKPAIELARDGFAVYPYIYRFWDSDRPRSPLSADPPPLVRLNATTECARIYLRDGRVLRVGEVLVQKDYGRTLERIAEYGPDVFYLGDVAQTMADDLERNGSPITRSDLQRCTALYYPLVRGTYRGYEFVTDGLPGIGPAQIEALHVLDNIDLRSYEPYTARYYDLLARVFQAMYSDRSRYGADPLNLDAPLDVFLSKERARLLAEKLMAGGRPGITEATPSGSHTTHISVLDGFGNAAGLMHSNGDTSGVVTPGLGFLYNNHMELFDPRPGHPNSVAPGKRGQSGCSPVMLFRDGEVKLISGSLTRYKVTSEFQALISILDFGEDVQTAVSRPRIHAEYAPNLLYVEEKVSPALLEDLRALGWSTQYQLMNTPLCIISLLHGDEPEVAVDPRGGGGHWPQVQRVQAEGEAHQVVMK